MNSPFKNLNRWFKEEWKTPSGEDDYSKGENTFRPTKKVSKDTPKTWSEVTPASLNHRFRFLNGEFILNGELIIFLNYYPS